MRPTKKSYFMGFAAVLSMTIAIYVNVKTNGSDFQIKALNPYLSPIGKVYVISSEPEPQHFNETLLPNVYKNYEQELKCLTENIYFEARGQHTIGQLAVGLVTLNRVVSKHYPNSICGVVWQKKINPKTKKMVAQFSWTLDNISNTPKKNTGTYRDIKMLAAFLLDRESAITDFTNGATHYHSVNVNPAWAKKITYLATYDEHLFYVEEK